MDEIVDAAVVLLDQEGLDGFSMRTLAARLGRSTMAAYRHIGNRGLLIELAVDAVHTEPPHLEEAPWFERLEAIARHGWTTCWRAHPWIVEVLDRPFSVSSPKVERRLQMMRDVFREAGFGPDETEQALMAHWSFVLGTLRLVLAIRRSNDPAAPSTTDWEDAIFDYNLRTWILGLAAMAGGLTPERLNVGGRTDKGSPTTHTSPKSRESRRPGHS